VQKAGQKAAAVWRVVERRLDVDRLAVFVDYDGTLAKIASRPEDAELADAQRARLARLHVRVPMAVVTGRGLADIRRCVGLSELCYAANHGFEIAGPGIEHCVAPELRPIFARVATELVERVGAMEGVIIEKKAYAVAIHYRLAPPGTRERLEAVVDALAAGSQEIRKGLGKKVFELRPSLDWHKGAAVEWLLDRFERSQPMYLGDDITDEDALSLVRERDGIAIRVGEPPAWKTAAELSLADVDEVSDFLDRRLQATGA
jgi:alpha,alpha-trehalase